MPWELVVINNKSKVLQSVIRDPKFKQNKQDFDTRKNACTKKIQQQEQTSNKKNKTKKIIRYDQVKQFLT